MSRIGNKPIQIPGGVKVEIRDNTVYVEGPKGKLNKPLSPRISVEQKDSLLTFKRATEIKTDKALHGLSRALVANMITGVTSGYTRELEIVGVGYKAQVQGKNLNLQLGFSHPVNIAIPEGITIESPKHTQVIVKGLDKELVGRISSEIRRACPPEPYKGKGIRYAGERIKKKVGKAQGK
ncbi:MAG: 50S ribosomal protein L6 [Candidatus Omnitrophica bacterium]|nr:50S ribosomal protein L6 [Candidatus Omnitrophota bacterium]